MGEGWKGKKEVKKHKIEIRWGTEGETEAGLCRHHSRAVLGGKVL